MISVSPLSSLIGHMDLGGLLCVGASECWMLVNFVKRIQKRHNKIENKAKFSHQYCAEPSRTQRA